MAQRAVLLCLALAPAHCSLAASRFDAHELRGSVPLSGRPLRAALADGSFAPERATFAFTGVTRGGFVDYRYDALVRNTTVRLGDYAALLAEPAAHAACQSHGSGFELELAVRSDAAAAAHLVDRLRVGHVVVLDEALAAAHVAFTPGALCAAAAAAAQPYYSITALDTRAAASGVTVLSVTLAAAPVDSAFHALDVTLEFDPDVGRALAARRAAGRSLGDAAAVAAFESGARAALEYDVASAAFELNYNAATGGALDPALRLIPGTDDLACNNCFLRLEVGVTLTLSMCFKGPGIYSSNFYDLDKGSNPSSLPAACSQLKGSTDASVSLSAVAHGSAAGSMGIVSSGIAASYTSCESGDLSMSIADAVGAPTNGCSSNIVQDVLQDTIQIRAAGIRISAYIYLGLDAAVLVPAPFPGSVEASASFAYDTQVGGTIAFASIQSPITITPVSSVSASSTAPTLAVTNFTGSAGALDVVLIPRFTVSLWDVVPLLSARPSMRYLAAVGGGSTTSGAGTAARAPAPQSLRVQSTRLVLAGVEMAQGGSTNGATIYVDTTGSSPHWNDGETVVVRLFGCVNFATLYGEAPLTVNGSIVTAIFPSSAFKSAISNAGSYCAWLYDYARGVYAPTSKSFYVGDPSVVVKAVAPEPFSVPLTGGQITITMVLKGVVMGPTYNLRLVDSVGYTFYTWPASEWPEGWVEVEEVFDIPDLTSCGATFGCSGDYYVKLCGSDSITGGSVCGSKLLRVTSSRSLASSSTPPAGGARAISITHTRALSAPRKLYTATAACSAGKRAYSGSMSTALGAYWESVSYDALLGTFSIYLVGQFQGNLLQAGSFFPPLTVTQIAVVGNGCCDAASGECVALPLPGPSSNIAAIVGGAVGASIFVVLACIAARILCKRTTLRNKGTTEVIPDDWVLAVDNPLK